jgi:branched-subunit amino acid aminotransferase/4-amino-4-deoxychorismate lyase
VVRAFVLGRLEVEIGHFPLSHLQEAEEIFLTSSIRGIASVNALPGCALADFSTANKLRAAYEEAIVVQLEVQP